jgi:hypothetical protein
MSWLCKLFGCCKDELSQIESLNSQIAGLKKQVEQLNTKSIDFPPVNGTISYSDVYNILSQYSSQVYVSDNSFSLTDLESCQKFVEETKVQYQTWVNDHHDCDNFSFELMGYFSEGMWSYVFGIAWSSEHAFNFFIDQNKQLYVVEPQTDNFIKIEDAKTNKLYYPWRMAIC